MNSNSIKKILVADHKDLNDKSQTVKVSEKPKGTPDKTTKKQTPKNPTHGSTPGTSGDTPKTGDERNPWLWIGMILAGGASILTSAILVRRRSI